MLKKTIVLLFSLIFGQTLFAQNNGDVLFGAAQIHTIEITFSQTSFWDSLVANYITDTYMSGDVSIDGTLLTNCGVKLKGNSSYNSYPGQKKPMNLDLNQYVVGQEYDGLKKLNLNNGFKDPTLLREKLFLDWCNDIGLPAPRCTFAKVYLNGTYWGLYTLVEQVNGNFCNIAFGNNEGNLFKGDPHGTLQYKGAAPNLYYTDYELKTNEGVNDWTDLVHLIDIINNTPLGNLYDSLDLHMDLHSFYKYQGSNIIFANLDSYSGSVHNYYLYHDTVSEKFVWILWDSNEAFGNFQMGMNVTQLQNLSISYIPAPANTRPLIDRMLQEPTLTAEYIDEVCWLTSIHLDSTVLFPKIDSLANAIRTDYYADTKKMFSNVQFESNLEQMINVPGLPGGSDIPGLKSFIRARLQSLQTQLAAYGCYLGNPENKQNHEILLSPNPCTDQLFITGSENMEIGTSIEIYDITGKKHSSFITSGEPKLCLNTADLPAGLYLLMINGSANYRFVVAR